MNKSSRQTPFISGALEFFATVWPPMLAADSELCRRKKTAIRIGHLAMTLILTLAVIGRIAAFNHPPLAAPQAAKLFLATLAYVLWFLYGLRETVRWMLWERATVPQPVWPPPADARQIFYFAALFGFTGLVCVLEGREGGSLVAWLVLLPPVSLSVFRLRWPGIVLVAGASLGIFAGVSWWHGWTSLTKGALEFSCAALFALLFPALAVTSEKARAKVERLAGELSAANERLREYAVHTGELAVTRERNRLAREIHDSLGHCLTVVNVQIEAARALRTRSPARMDDALNKAQALTQQGLQEVRRSVATLRASPLDNRSLTEALRQIVDQDRAGGLAVEMEVRGEPHALSPQARLTLYRAGQEGLTNVRKHSRTTQARLVLDFQPGKVSLRVADHGVGATTEAAGAGGFGLLGLRERAQLLGGSVRVQTAPDAGFCLEVEVPE